MKKLAKQLTVLGLVALFVSPLMAEDKKKEGKKGKGNAGSQLLKTTLKKLKKAELSDEQTTKIKELASQWQGKIAEAMAKGKLTKEQAEKLAEARKAALAEGKKGKDVVAAAQEAAGLSDEQKEAQAAAGKMRNEFNKLVFAMLSDEQKTKAGIKAGKGKGKGDRAKKKKKDAAETE